MGEFMITSGYTLYVLCAGSVEHSSCCPVSLVHSLEEEQDRSAPTVRGFLAEPNSSVSDTIRAVRGRSDKQLPCQYVLPRVQSLKGFYETVRSSLRHIIG